MERLDDVAGYEWHANSQSLNRRVVQSQHQCDTTTETSCSENTSVDGDSPR